MACPNCRHEVYEPPPVPYDEFADGPACEWSVLAWLKLPSTKRLHHHEIRRIVGLPCDEKCFPPAPKPTLGKSLIERVKEQWRIERVAEQLTELRWRGQKGSGRCPFHPDRSPSFSVDSDRQTWRCWAACGHGDVIDLVRMAEERGLRVGR